MRNSLCAGLVPAILGAAAPHGARALQQRVPPGFGGLSLGEEAQAAGGYLAKSPPGTRILVVGSVEFVSNSLPEGSLEFLVNAVRFLSCEHDLIRIREAQDDLNPVSRDILQDLSGELSVTVFLSSNLPAQFHERRRHVVEMLAEMEACSGGLLRTTVVDPWTSDQARAQADELGVSRMPVQQVREGAFVVEDVFQGLLIEHRGRSEVVPSLFTSDALEYEIMVRVEKLARHREIEVAFYLDDLPEGTDRPFSSGSRRGPTPDLQLLDFRIAPWYETRSVNLESSVPEAVKTLVVRNAYDLAGVQQYYLTSS